MAYSGLMSRFWVRHQTTVIALAGTAAFLALLFLLWTPACLWAAGSVSECRRMTCELVAMRRPHADHGWCEAWFELFRDVGPSTGAPGAPAPPVD